MECRRFLFLQGPICPFFRLTANSLEASGNLVYRVNFCAGDWLFWRRKNGINYRGRLEGFADFIADLIQEKEITSIVLLGEQRAYHKIAVEVAKNLAVQVVVTDLGYLRPDWITLELNGISKNSLFPRDPQQILAQANKLPNLKLQTIYRDKFYLDALPDMSYHFSNIFFKPLFPYYQPYIIYNPLRTYLGVGWHILKNKLYANKTKQIIAKIEKEVSDYYVFPLQLEQDYQIRAYSPYASLREALREVIESFASHAPNDASLIIKIHPLDPLIINWEKISSQFAKEFNVTTRVVFIYGGQIESLFARAKGIVVVNSTMGVWALNYGLAVITLGDALYNINGLVMTRSYLDQFWLQPQLPDLKLRDAFFKLLAATIQIKGSYYNAPGLKAAVSETSLRLGRNQLNQPLRPWLDE